MRLAALNSRPFEILLGDPESTNAQRRLDVSRIWFVTASTYCSCQIGVAPGRQLAFSESLTVCNGLDCIRCSTSLRLCKAADGLFNGIQKTNIEKHFSLAGIGKGKMPLLSTQIPNVKIQER